MNLDNGNFLSANTERDTIGVVMHSQYGVVATVDGATGSFQVSDGSVTEVIAMVNLVLETEAHPEGVLVPTIAIGKESDGRFVSMMPETGFVGQGDGRFHYSYADTFSDAMAFVYKTLQDAMDGMEKPGEMNYVVNGN